MLFNYLKSAWRNITRNKFYAVINIAGLSIGFLTTILILLFVQDELNYDKHHSKYERIYRIESNFNINGKHDKFAIVPIPMGPAFKIEFPEVEEFVRFSRADDIRLRYKEKEFAEDNVYYTDSTIFKVFDHVFVNGEAKNALNEPNTVVLTKQMAEKYFGKNNPIGEIIRSNENYDYKVTAVIENLPSNSHLKFDALLSAATLVKAMGAERFNSLEPNMFWNIGVFTYVLLKPNSSIESVYKKFPAFYNKYMAEIGKQINAGYELMSNRLDQVHHSAFIEADLPKGSKSYIYLFLAIAVFILVLAAINYMNMATARSAIRSREVGIRKVLGAYRGQLMRQFFGESVILSVISLVIALTLAAIILPSFNAYSNRLIGFGSLFSVKILTGSIIISILVGLLSGMYPALFLSSFQPTVVLKGLGFGGQRGLLRKSLVVFQFIISVVMIMGTLTIRNQLEFLKTADIGLDKENVLVAVLQDTTFRKKIPQLRDELLKNPHIKGVSTSSGIPGNMRSIVVMKVEMNGKMQDLAVNFSMVDTGYVDLMKLRIIKGRNFDKNMKTDFREAVIVNEAAVRKFGWGNDALGKKVDFGIDLKGGVEMPTKVIGVVKDFNYVSLQNPIEPFAIFLTKRPMYFLSIRIDGSEPAKTLDFIREKWTALGSPDPYDYSFLGSELNNMYDGEQKLTAGFGVASSLSIFIALLGLLGLSSFIAERRTREIGIRKVLGASSLSLMQMLYREFVILVGIAFVIAAPVATWGLDKWLGEYAFHTAISWGIYVLAAILSLGIAILTTTYHTVKTVRTNPVMAIKYE
jgi:putative ABC transport system permease protein